MRFAIDVGKITSPDGLGTVSRELTRALAARDDVRSHRILPVDLVSVAPPEDLAAALPPAFALVVGNAAAEKDWDALLSIAWAVPAGYDGPLLYVVHDLTFLSHPELHTLENRVHCTEGILRAVIAGATFLCVSEATASELVRLLGVDRDRIEVCHLAPVPELAPLEPADARERVGTLCPLASCVDGWVLAVGTFEPRKNLLRLLDAHRSLPDRLRLRHPLVVVGGGGWRNGALVARLDEEAQAGLVHVVGQSLDTGDLAALYSGAAVFVYPSLAEGFGLPVVEAMACGAPVITSDRSSMPEVAGGAARLVDPDDTESITQALEGLLDNPTERERMRQEGLQRAADFSWDRTAQRVFEILERLASQRPDR